MELAWPLVALVGVVLAFIAVERRRATAADVSALRGDAIEVRRMVTDLEMASKATVARLEVDHRRLVARVGIIDERTKVHG